MAVLEAGTSLREVLVVLETLRAAGCRTWVGGGWGVDALVGVQTRVHRDLDLAIDGPGLAGGMLALAELGYVLDVDWLPVRVELHRPGRGRVDLHPLSFDQHGDAIQAGWDGVTYRYPRDGFVHGLLAGVEVGCLSPALQRAFHEGYDLRDVDHHDLDLLRRLEPR